MRRDPRHLSDECLLLLIDGELSPGRTATADMHLARCVFCQIRLKQINAAAVDSGRLFEDELASQVGPSSRSRERLQVRLAQLSADLGRPWSARVTERARAIPGWAYLAAAVLVATLLTTPAWRSWFAKAGRVDLEAAALPVASLTPGATRPITTDELCTGARQDVRVIATSVRREVLRDYGMEAVSDDEYELDYLITPELGGTSDRRNLWPERYSSRLWNARVKDELERLLPQLVCQRKLDLETAQRDLADNWIAAYKKYFHTNHPLHAFPS
jgi:hypothetical protein